MTLTGAGLIILLVAITFLLPCAGVLLWPRVRGGRVVAGIQRVTIVLVCQVATLALFAAMVNDYGYFYTTWGQARSAIAQALGVNANDSGSGSGSGGTSSPRVASLQTNPAAHRLVATSLDPASAGSVKLLDHTGNLTQWKQNGRVESVTILGAISGLREHAFVYLPPQYFAPADAEARFPAIEVMTGYPGDDAGLLHRLSYTDILPKLVRAGQAKPTVLVMLRPSVVFPRDTECSDVPGGPQVLTYLAADVPAQIAHAFRVQPTRWGAIGDSTGGYCAVKLAMTHPLQFPAAVPLSGYYFAAEDDTTGDLWGGSSAVRRSNDLFWRMRHLPPPPVSLLIATAKTEKGDDGYAENIAFSKIVRAPTKVSMLVESTGGHSFSTWIREIPIALQFLSARIGEPQ